VSPDPPDPPAPAARPARALLVDRRFGPWFWGNLASNTGNWLFNVTAAIVVFQLTGSALLVGMLSLAQYASLALLSPLAGAWSDRFDRRRLLLGAQVFSAAWATAIAVAVVAVGVDGLPGAWPLLVTAAGIGIGQSVAAPALNALVPAMVDDVDLESAVALTSFTFNIGRALGPATSGVLLATLGAEVAFVVNAVSFAVLILALLVIRVAARPTLDGDRSVRAGLRYVRDRRLVLLLLAGVAAAGFAADPIITLSPPLAQALGAGETLAAALVSAFGIMAAPAALASGKLQRRFGGHAVAGTGMAAMACGLSAAAVAPVPAVALGGFGLTGVGFVLAVTGFTTMLQRQVDEAVRGRVMALWTVAFLGNRPVAAVLDGGAADLVGPRAAKLIAIVVALSGVWLARRLAAASATDVPGGGTAPP
jgi:MFS family permease